VFLREEGGTTFVPVYHQSSVTLRDLAEEFNISSVLECDAQGNVQPRAVAFDSPSDILHSGRHYIARRDARAEMGSSYVTFKGKICVKEYELEHPTPPTTRAGKTVTVTIKDPNGGIAVEPNRRKPVATPFAEKRRYQETLGIHEEHLAAYAAEGNTPVLQRTDGQEREEVTISRALALSSERKRPREEDTTSKPEAIPYARLQNNSGDGDKNGASEERGYEKAVGVLSFLSPIPKTENLLHDRTNSSTTAPGSALKTQGVPASNELHRDDATDPQTSNTTVPLPQKQSLRFIPFLETAADGTETYVTLESLRQMCNDLASQESDFQRKHRAATDILESARRVLFLNDGSD
jgi:hypothetical protein